jgi:hypothetical protein
MSDMTDEGTTPIPGDAELIRYLDGELDGAAAARVDAALATHPPTRERLEQLRRRGERVGDLLRQTDPDVPAALATNPFRTTASGNANGSANWLLRAAAVLLIAAGAITLVPPLRAWVVDGVQRVLERDPVDSIAASSSVVPDTFDVAFDVQSTLDFELLMWQREGTLRIRVAEAATATAQIHTRSGLEEFYVIPGGVRVNNANSSIADYELVVPTTVRMIRVTIGGDRVAEYGTFQPENRERTFVVTRRADR